QELINSAKVKNMANDFRNIQVYVYSYQDKFRALPGDDKAAVQHVTATNNGNGNGIIEGAWNATGATVESLNFWQHIRLAGLATGSTVITDTTYSPTNAEGGPVGVQSASTPSISGLKGSYVVCSGGILGKFAKELDTAMDDGNTATGIMMTASSVDGTTASTAVTNVATTPTLLDSSKYIVCMAF
ncbi:MAG TPA: prepilin-type cleavage/methylation domain-containing protein, partial [Methylotenera mobilis]|nr:prepilin-type cleavage/methylation domain-containing protein [Methylotenera mobilis]